MAHCRSREGAWIEINLLVSIIADFAVAPARERGLKYELLDAYREEGRRRSREGAWIEMLQLSQYRLPPQVAPARERGLKYHAHNHLSRLPLVAPARERGLKFDQWEKKTQWLSRSREGAWIEISACCGYLAASSSLPRGSVD